MTMLWSALSLLSALEGADVSAAEGARWGVQAAAAELEGAARAHLVPASPAGANHGHLQLAVEADGAQLGVIARLWGTRLKLT